MKTVLYSICALCGLAIFAALIVPGLIDWDRYKDQMVARAGEELGRTIFVDGHISLAVLPIPTFSVSGVRVINPPGTDLREMVRLKSLNVQVELLPLLAGSIEVAKIVLVEPDIVLERFPDGRVNWALPLIAPRQVSGDRADSDGVFPQVILDQIDIRNGTLTYLDSVKGFSERLEKIDLIVSAPSVRGPYDISGAINFRGSRVEIAGGILELVGDKKMGLSATLLNNGLSFNIAGTSDRERVPFIDGSANIRGSDLASVAKFADLFMEKPVPMPWEASESISLETDFSYHGETLVIQSLVLRSGDISGTGSGEVSFSDPPNFDLTFALGRLNLDNWPNLRGDEAGDPLRSPGFSVADSALDLDAADTTFFGSMSGMLDLSVDAVFFRSQAIRDLSVRVNTVGSGLVEVQEISALLPGGSDLTFFGSFEYEEGKPRFLGEINGSSENFRALLDWMNFDVNEVPPDRLRRVNLVAAIDGTLASGEVTDIDLHFDATHLTGGVAYAIHGSRPGFGVGLQVDQLNVDAYLPQIVGESEQLPESASAEEIVNENTPPPALPKLPQALQVLSAFDADFNIGFNNLTLHGTPMSGLMLDGLLQQNSLTLRQARIGEFTGSTVSFSGLVSELGGNPSVDGTISFSTEKLGALARMVPPLDDLPVGLLGPMGVEAQIKGSAEALELEGIITALESELKVNGTLTGPSDSLQFDLSTYFDSPNLASFLENITAGEIKTESGGLELDGPISVMLDIDGDLSALHLAGITKFSNGELRVAGSILNLLDAAEIQIQSKLKHPNLNSLFGVLGREFDHSVTLLESPVSLEFALGGLVTELDLQGQLFVADLEMDFAGRVEGWPGSMLYESQIEVNHPDIGALISEVGLSEVREGTKRPAVLRAEVSGTSELLSVLKINLDVAETNIAGSMAIEMGGERPRLTADLSAEEFVAKHFLAPATLLESDMDPNPSNAGSAVPVGESPNVEAEARWSDEPIDLAGLGKLDANLKLRADSVIFSNQKFDDVRLAVNLDDSYLTVHALSGRAFDGEIEVSATIDGRVTPSMEFSGNLQGGEMEQLFLQAAQIDMFTGKIDAEVEISGQGRSRQEIMASLKGEGSVNNASEGTIKGVNLRSLSDQIGAMEDIGDFIGLAKLSFEGGATGYTKFGGHFDIVNGELQTNDFSAVLDGGSANVLGAIDLVNLTQDLALTFTLTDGPEIPEVTLTLRGPLDNPSYGIETRGIEKLLLERGLDAVIKETVMGEELGIVAKVTDALTGEGEGQNLSDDIRGAADALIDELIGGVGSAGDEVSSVDGDGTPAPLPVPSEDGPEDLFKDLIKNLLRE